MSDEFTAKKVASGFIIFLVFCLGAWYSGQALPNSTGSWYSILPPLVAVVLAFVTRRLMTSLAIAVVVGAVAFQLSKETGIASVFNGLLQAGTYSLGALSDYTNFLILAFVVFILAMISIIIKAGGFQAIVEVISRRAKTARSTQAMTVLLGIAVFIDDYANTMIVGSTMRELNDKKKISREKLAFLVDATSAPVAGIALISTWVGFEVLQFSAFSSSLNLGKDGYTMLLDALPYRFYCFMMLLFVIINVFSRKDFGPMAQSQQRSANEGKLLADNASPMTDQSFSVTEPDQNARPRIHTVMLPFAVLFATLFIGFYLEGGGLEHQQKNSLAFLSLTTWKQVFAQANNDNVKILAIAAFTGMITALLSSMVFSRVRTRSLLSAAMRGARGSLLPILILVLAWSLKASCDDLETGKFLMTTYGQVLSPLWFPVLLFTIAGFTSFGTGTSWGTMAILIPTALPIAYNLDGNSYGIVTIMSMGAVLDGSILGDHCSPISDTTIMSSIAASCDHLHHVQTQIPYSLLVGFVAMGSGYIPAAMGLHPGLCLLIALLFFVLFWQLVDRQRLFTTFKLDAS